MKNTASNNILQQALNRLYSLKKGVNNDYPYLEYIRKQKFDIDKEISKLINQDKDKIQLAIDTLLTVEEIDLVMRRVNCLKEVIFQNSGTMDMCNSISDKLQKQKEMWDNKGEKKTMNKKIVYDFREE